MANRPELTHQAFSEEFFPPEMQAIARRVREILDRHIQVDGEKTRPADRILEDLHLSDLDSMADVEFIMELEREFGISIPDEEAQQLFSEEPTLADFIRHVARKLNDRR